MQDDPIREGENDPGVEPGAGDAPPDEPGLEDLRGEPHDVDDDRPA
jgi:hypothetical protein